jgi:hypothetical protein
MGEPTGGLVDRVKNESLEQGVTARVPPYVRRLVNALSVCQTRLAGRCSERLRQEGSRLRLYVPLVVGPVTVLVTAVRIQGALPGAAVMVSACGPAPREVGR